MTEQTTVPRSVQQKVAALVLASEPYLDPPLETETERGLGPETERSTERQREPHLVQQKELALALASAPYLVLPLVTATVQH